MDLIHTNNVSQKNHSASSDSLLLTEAHHITINYRNIKILVGLSEIHLKVKNVNIEMMTTRLPFKEIIDLKSLITKLIRNKHN